MGTPRCPPLIPGVNDDAIRSVITGLAQRAGIGRLLRGLGFDRPPVPVDGPVPPGLRALQATRRTTLTAFIGELRRPFHSDALRETARALRARDGVSPHLLLLTERGRRQVILAISLPGSPVRHLVLEPAHVRAADSEVLGEFMAASAEGDTAAAVRMLRALDRVRISTRFFRDVVSIRDLVARHWTGVPRPAREERNALALLLLSRLMFLYFLQRRGVLDGDERFMPRLLEQWDGLRRGESFYRVQLRTLFFGVLNREPAQRTARARAMGELPYLNGGLFEAHRLEKLHRQHDIADVVLQRVFHDLLEKYRFTSSEAHDDHAGEACGADVDPEMLGRIFEGLMPGDQRERTGTFYTPSDLVDRVVTDALTAHLANRCAVPETLVRHALQGAPAGGAAALSGDTLARLRRAAAGLRVLDPACGSGAFLLGSLGHIARLRSSPAAAIAAVRRDVVSQTLHGVDLVEDAALICSLRLWLALIPPRGTPGAVPPLPNLDRRIRQGDALVDPLDLGIALGGRPLETTAPPELRSLVGAVEPAAAAYLRAGPVERPALRRKLDSLERSLAVAWLSALEGRLSWTVKEIAARAGDTDLFGEPAPHAVTARRQLATAQRRYDELSTFVAEVDGRRRLPFFSFRVHFAEASDGFDMVLSNPPWVRAHNWPPTVRRLLRERFHVCARAGWPATGNGSVGFGAAGSGSQVDLSLLFIEKSLGLLKPRGTLAMLLPAKTLRSLYAGGARDLLLNHADMASIDDHSLDHRSVFDADAFTAVIIAHKRPLGEDASPATGKETVAGPAGEVSVTLRRAGTEPLHFTMERDELSLMPGDANSPWLLVPPDCRAALRRMQAAGPWISRLLSIRRGVMTGANDVMVIREVEPKLGDIAHVRAEGHFRAASTRGRAAFSAYIEGSALRPVLRGADVGAWQASVGRHVIWAPCNDEPRAPMPPRLQRYLQRHRARLTGSPAAHGALQRLQPETTGHKVIWPDLAADLRAAAVPAFVRGVMGSQVPVVPLNTVYFIPTASGRESMLLSAYLNALPVRLFARCIAERAKDAHFRFFAWTIGVLPLPENWQSNLVADRLRQIAQSAHVRGACTPAEQAELDRLVALAYGLSDEQLAALRAFDSWLAARPAAIETRPVRATG
jgi:hypothetical protein